ncbi:MAG TPA: serine protease, partial [Verrucomicrobiae bacterium]|nr:serine protease [Verrucomicrobiae bacterium]
WDISGGILGPEEFNHEASQTLRDCGFTVLDGETGLLAEDDSYKVRYQLGATIQSMTLDAYDFLAGDFSEATVVAEWRLKDTSSRQIVFTNTSYGFAKENGFSTGVLTAAFGDALKKMVAASDLADLIATNGTFYVTATDAVRPVAAGVPIRIKVPHYVPSRSLPEDLDTVNRGIVTVEAGKTVGCGVIVSPDGYVLTAAHLLSGKTQVVVRFRAGLQLNAVVVRIDREQDLALLKLPGTSYPAVELNLTAPASVGSVVYVIGPPLNGNPEFTIGKGVISAYREGSDGQAQLIQTDATSNSGNSGGPMLDQSGRVIGIMSQSVVIPDCDGGSFGVPLDGVAKRLNILWRKPKP